MDADPGLRENAFLACQRSATGIADWLRVDAGEGMRAC